MSLRKLHNKKGMGMSSIAINAVMLIVIVGALSYVGFQVNNRIKSSAISSADYSLNYSNSSANTEEENSFINLESNVLSGFDLLGVIFVVAAAAAIFVLLRGGFIGAGGA